MIYIKFAVGCIFFTIASYTDIREQKIRKWVFPTMAVIVTILNIIGNNPIEQWINCFVGGAVGFICFLTVALFSKCGGADVIMAGCTGLAYGFSNLWRIILLACGGCFVYFVVEVVYAFVASKKIRQKFPMAPFFMFGFIISQLFIIL